MGCILLSSCSHVTSNCTHFPIFFSAQHVHSLLLSYMPTTHLCSTTTNSYPVSVSKHVHNKHKYPPLQNLLGAPPFLKSTFPYFQTPTLSSDLQLNFTQLSTPAHMGSSYLMKSVTVLYKNIEYTTFSF